MSIPSNLIESIKSKNVVLFLGSGFAYNAIHPSNSKPPLGQDLANLISKRFLNGAYNGYPLTLVSELAISETSLFEFQNFIRETFEGFSPNENHISYASFPWKAIFTTNYDLIVEKAYNQNKGTVQDLVPVSRNTPEQHIFRSPNSLPYYKLHGCINNINSIDLPLILTTDQYVTHKLNRERLFSKLFELAMDYPILFIGYSNQDPNIRSILLEIEALKDAKPRSYMVRPGFRDEEIRFWEGKKITAINLGHEDFIKAVENEITINDRRLSTYIPDFKKPIYKKFLINVADLKPSESLLNFLDNESEFVHSSIPSKETSPQAFYKGFFQNWDPIIKNLDIERNEKDRILTQLILDDKYQSNDEPYFFVLKGYAGSGKSVLLKRIAWEASIEFDKLCIFINSNTSLRYEPILELYNYVKERIYIFIDNTVDNSKGIATLLEKAEREKVPITIIGSERTNLWNEDSQLKTFINEEFTISYLTPKEIDKLIDKLEKHNSLGYLQNKNKEERQKEFNERAGRVLLVALYEATGGKPFEEIILDEYNQITSEQAKSLYLTVAILHRLGSEARAGLISRVHGINFNQFKEKLYKPLEFIVFDEKNYTINDYVYKTRHQHIAQIVFETVLTTEQDRYDAYVRILSYLDIDYRSDQNAFLAMTNARKLNEIFKDPIKIRNLFNIAESRNKMNPKLLQQKAIFEMISNGGSLSKAEEYLKEAHELIPKDPIVSHSLAELSLKKAEESRNRIEKMQYLSNAKKLCDSIIRKHKEHPHSYHTLLKVHLLRLRESLDENDPPSIEAKIKDIEKLLNTARQYFPDQEFILEVEARFNELIDNEPKALDLLRKAHFVNKATPYIALRLARVLEVNGQIEEALKVLSETLNLNPNEKDVNFRYAQLLTIRDPENESEILHYYRRSFTVGDTRYESQFWYARELYKFNQIVKAKEMFEILSRAKVAPSQKKEIRGTVYLKNKLQSYHGSIKTKEAHFGFLERDGVGDIIYINSFSELKNSGEPKVGARISFNLAFNYYGAIAINSKIEKY